MSADTKEHDPFAPPEDIQDSKVLLKRKGIKSSSKPHPVFQFVGRIYPIITAIFLIGVYLGAQAGNPLALRFYSIQYHYTNPLPENFHTATFAKHKYAEDYYYSTFSKKYPEWKWYLSGPDDLYTGISMGMALLFTHWVLQTFFLKPTAKAFGLEGIKIQKFCEAGYFAVYYPLSFFSGLYILYHSSWFSLTELNLAGPEQYPNALMPQHLKIFYIFTTSNWFAQVVVLFIEDRRSDFKLYLFHHFVTIILCVLSYKLGWVSFGTTIMALLDASDCFLYLGKCILYIGESINAKGPIYAYKRAQWKKTMGEKYKPSYHPYPGFFVVADILLYLFGGFWILTRHLIFIPVIYSAYFDVKASHCYGINDPDQGCIMSTTHHGIFMFCLIGLEVAMIFWLKEIIRIALQPEIKDIRSD